MKALRLVCRVAVEASGWIIVVGGLIVLAYQLAVAFVAI